MIFMLYLVLNLFLSIFYRIYFVCIVYVFALFHRYVTSKWKCLNPIVVYLCLYIFGALTNPHPTLCTSFKIYEIIVFILVYTVYGIVAGVQSKGQRQK